VFLRYGVGYAYPAAWIEEEKQPLSLLNTRPNSLAGSTPQRLAIYVQLPGCDSRL